MSENLKILGWAILIHIACQEGFAFRDACERDLIEEKEVSTVSRTVLTSEPSTVTDAFPEAIPRS